MFGNGVNHITNCYTKENMKILAIHDGSGPKYHRILLPVSLMPEIEVIISHVIEPESLQGVDIVFCNRIVGNTSLQRVLDLRTEYGFKLVVDYDDHWILDPTHYLFEYYQHYNVSEAMEAWITEADMVTVTHERLRQEVLPINANCHVLPNAIPRFGQFDITRTPDSLTRLFWAGGITHERDINILFHPVKKFRGLPVKMVMGGYSKKPEYYKMRNAFTRYGRMEHELIEALPVNQYYYAYSKCDIALIPLEKTRFNSFKSNLKILEAANVGANVVVSNVDPYKDVPGVEYVNEPEDWKNNIVKLIANPEYAASQIELLKSYCEKHFNFYEINKQRLNLFKDVTSQQGQIREVQGEVQYTG